MANNFIDKVSQAQVIATSFDNMTVRPLRPRYVFDGMAKEKSWNLNSNPNKGDALQFPVLDAISANTAALDPTNATITGSVKTVYTRRSVTLTLFGDHATVDTIEFRPEAFVDAMADVAFSMQDQGMNSLNLIARQAFFINKFSNEVSGTLSSTFHYFGSQGTVSTIGPLKAIDVRLIVADLKADNVETFEDGFYMAVVHPNVSTQLRAETGNAAWGAAVLAGDGSVQRRFNGDIGTFEGVRFIVNPAVNGAGTGTLTSYFTGREGVGKAIGKDLSVSMKPELEGPHSNLAVFRWNALVGYKVIRREAVRIVSTTASKL